MIDLDELERLANELASDTLERFLSPVGRSNRVEAMCDAVPALIAEVRRLRARPGVHSASFMDLHFPVNVSIVDVLEEAPKALGYQITTDESHEVKLRAGQPRLGTIVTLVHEMLHVAESASGIGVPHQYIAMSSVGAVLALARCGVLGADDAEIADFIEYMKTCESVDGEDEDEAPELLDPIEECERLMTENERLRAEVERRPEITPEDARYVEYVKVEASHAGIDAAYRMEFALRVHAAKVKP